MNTLAKVVLIIIFLVILLVGCLGSGRVMLNSFSSMMR
jgi:hypothetical protein